jgi:hypothetical protein
VVERTVKIARGTEARVLKMGVPMGKTGGRRTGGQRRTILNRVSENVERQQLAGVWILTVVPP